MFAWSPFSRKGIRSLDESDARLNFWEGAVRSSKTICSIIRWIEYVKTAPPGPLVMIGKTERTLKRNILDPMSQILGKKRFKTRYGSGEVVICGRAVYLVGANDERAETKIRGGTFAGAYGDEITLWPESFFNMLLSRLSVEDAKFFGTTNPDNPFHWLYVNFIKRALLGELDAKVFHFSLGDNLSLNAKYVANLKQEYRGLWYKRYIQGLWVAAEGAVYQMFDTDVHLVDKLPKMSQYFVGCDYGTTNPTVFLLLGVGVDKKLYVADEWRYDSTQHAGKSMTDAEYSLAYQKWIASHKVDGKTIKPKWIFIDPSAASFKVQLFRDGVKGLQNANNDVLDGIHRTSTLFSAGCLHVHKRCVGLIEELCGYAWDSKTAAKGKEQPIKVGDHGPDALRYVINGTYYIWKTWVKTRFEDETLKEIQSEQDLSEQGKAA